MPSLKSQIEILAQEFANGILAAIGEATTADLARELVAVKASANGTGRAPEPSRPRAPKVVTTRGRLPRRSADQIQGVLTAILGALAGKEQGLTSEQLQATLGLSKKELVGVVKRGLDQNALTKAGEKRATRYFAR